MPHQRDRSLVPLIEKRLKLFPVVGLLGGRQTGKSTILRELLSKKIKTEYLTLDREENRKRALQAPSLFIKNFDDKMTAIIDEVQKAPSLFDTIKAEVDEKKRPGRFLLSGSTEFSKKTGIQESLTGRISLLRLFPMTVSEILERKNKSHLLEPKKQNYLKEINLWLERGGMPGICFVRENEQRESLFESWLET